MAWYDSPAQDPYTYTLIDDGPPRLYKVERDGRPLGVISAARFSTDTRIAGTRQRRIGKGRAGFAAGIPNRHSFTGTHLGGINWSEPGGDVRRRDAARELERAAERDDRMTATWIADTIARHTTKDTP